MTKIARRNMLRTIGGISLAGMLPLNGEATEIGRQSQRTINTLETDVLIVGGGTAGVIAAIQAARAGCSTILVENGSQLGGTTTTGGVAFPGLFHAWEKQVIGGIGWELVTEAVKLDDGKLPDFTVPTGLQHWRHQIRLNSFLYALLAEEKCLEAGVLIRYYESPVAATFKQNSWLVETTGKGTHTRIKCNQLIDCTGNGSVTSLAGFNVLRDEVIQPGTLMFKLGGYDPEALDYKYLESKYDEAVNKNEMVRSEFRNIQSLLRSRGDNNQHILLADSTTSETHTVANIKGRSSLLRMLKFLRTLPGCENTHLLSMQQETAVRETYRIEGEYQITHEDYITGKVFDDAVSYSFYPIDLHDEKGIIPKHLSEHTVATIPLRALIPKNSSHFLVAGRCISSDRLANSALRVQASCMAMGQAAGAAAVLASKLKTTPLHVPIYQLSTLITKYGGIVP